MYKFEKIAISNARMDFLNGFNDPSNSNVIKIEMFEAAYSVISNLAPEYGNPNYMTEMIEKINDASTNILEYMRDLKIWVIGAKYTHEKQTLSTAYGMVCKETDSSYPFNVRYDPCKSCPMTDDDGECLLSYCPKGKFERANTEEGE